MKVIFHFYLHNILNFYHHKNLRDKNMFQNLSRVSIFFYPLPHISGGETMEIVTDFLFWGSKITADGDCSHEIKKWSLLGRKVMTNLDSILKSRDITMPTKVCLVKSLVSPVIMDGYKSWTIKKAEHWRINAFELWCWKRLLRVSWTARKFNQSIIKEISPEYSLVRLMLKLKLQYFGHLMWRTESFD